MKRLTFFLVLLFSSCTLCVAESSIDPVQEALDAAYERLVIDQEQLPPQSQALAYSYFSKNIKASDYALLSVLICGAENFYFVINPPYIECHRFVFTDHLESERHLYHNIEGIVIWGLMIKGFEPDFVPVFNDFSPIAPWPDISLCPSFEIYPDSNLCARHYDQHSAEYEYDLAVNTNYQYWDKLGRLLEVKEPTVPAYCMNFKLPKSLWKPGSETQAGKATSLLSQKEHCPADTSITNQMKPKSIYLEDLYGHRLETGTLRHCNKENQGRLHVDFPKGSGEALMIVEFEDRSECYHIPDRSKRWE